jgi:aldehyde dehydrogenase (NAD+)
VDAEFCARYFEFYGTAADKLLGETIPYRAGFTVMTLREPFGVTGHIVPWNYPLQIMGRSVGASLAAGNACVVKPAEDASLSILRVAELALECGLPVGAFNVVTGLGGVAGAALAAHPGIDHISFTGSPATGAAVQAAAARNNVGCTMELGGKSAQIVFADADIDAAVPALVSGIIQNAGQTCSAGSRALIERPAWERVVGKLAVAFRDLTIGLGRDDPAIGPLINARQHARVKGFVAKARSDGIPVLAEATVPGNAPAGGYFVPPILFGPVPAEHPIAQEEVFGPVLAATPFDTEEEAIRLANGTPYGLVAGVWTGDGARQMRMAAKLRCGQVFLNNFGAGGGVELPFGGVKRSGFGREKGLEGLKSFTVLKTVAIKHG